MYFQISRSLKGLCLFSSLLMLFCLGNSDGKWWSEAQAQVTAAPLVLHHRLKIVPDLDNSILTIEDEIELTGHEGTLQAFELNKAFTVEYAGKVLQASETHPNGTNVYQLPETSELVRLKYSGQLQSTPLCNWLTEACRRLDKEGIYLDAASAWYPDLPNALHTFEMSVLDLPEKWVSLSQGQQTATGWQELLPQKAIYLLASHFKVYQQEGSTFTAMVYLRSTDDALAEKYLQATQHYIEQYSHLLGNYPYSKFATVESFWETGWGMPSFTLLGSRVMRLPFILDSSFPHEILHNWWGNSVYIDASEGNWTEGLTAYLADYRIQELKGEGTKYRRDMLQKYLAFTQSGEDFPLKAFRSRHDHTTQAVGYSKSLMFFHDLRQRLGDKVFFLSLRHFYDTHVFQQARFSDLRHSFEAVSKQDLKPLFQQWLARTGAPQLKIADYTFTSTQTEQKEHVSLQLSLEQAENETFDLYIPVLASFAEQAPEIQYLTMNQLQQNYTLEFATKPLQVAVDPDFDVFRLPSKEEVPPALNVLFNRTPKTFVIARNVPAGMELEWNKLAEALAKNLPESHIQYDDEPLPDGELVVLLGADNAVLTAALLHAQQPFKLNETAFVLNSVSYTCGLHSLALSLSAGKQQLILLDAPTPETLALLMRKIPHYGKYSYVLFDNATGKNAAKGQWEMDHSPMVIKPN
ncbi:MAG: peptidase M28 [Proteobacteria bacterium]|nr:MAG: peptidase M28 [Pseudomonadota bacterium]